MRSGERKLQEIVDDMVFVCVIGLQMHACLSTFVALEGVFSAFRCLFQSVCGISRRKIMENVWICTAPPPPRSTIHYFNDIH